MKQAVLTFLISFFLFIGLFTHFSESSCAGGHHDRKDCTPVSPIPVTESLLSIETPTISCTPTPDITTSMSPTTNLLPTSTELVATPTPRIGSPASANNDTTGGSAEVSQPVNVPAVPMTGHAEK